MLRKGERRNISKTSARISSEVPNTEKLMKARGRRPSSFIVLRCTTFRNSFFNETIPNYAVLQFFQFSLKMSLYVCLKGFLLNKAIRNQKPKKPNQNNLNEQAMLRKGENICFKNAYLLLTIFQVNFSVSNFEILRKNKFVTPKWKMFWKNRAIRHPLATVLLRRISCHWLQVYHEISFIGIKIKHRRMICLVNGDS